MEVTSSTTLIPRGSYFISPSCFELWTAFTSFLRVRGLIVFLPFLKFMIAELATPD